MMQRIVTILLLVVLACLPVSARASSSVDPVSWISRVSDFLESLFSIVAADEEEPAPVPQEEPDQAQPATEPQESAPGGGTEQYPGWDPAG
jgi:hypothetical protein